MSIDTPHNTDQATIANNEGNQAREIDAQDLTQYLADHPDFLNNYLRDKPEVLADIDIPSTNRDTNIHSLAQKQTQVLRERKANSDSKLIEFVENAAENDFLFSQTRKFVLAVMRCASRQAVIELIHDQFTNEFDVAFTSAELIERPEQSPKLDFLDSSGKERFFSGAIRPQESNILFEHEQAESSVAMCRKLNDGKILFIAVGDQDPNFYYQGIGADFIEFLADSSAEMLNMLG